MEPLLCGNDHVLTFNWRKLKVDDAIVFRYCGLYLVKRIKKASAGKYYVEGDNRALSLRGVWINKGDVVGKVILKY